MTYRMGNNDLWFLGTSRNLTSGCDTSADRTLKAHTKESTYNILLNQEN